MSFFDKLSALCKERGTSPSAVAREIGLNNSSATYWKRGAVPKGDTLKKLADYFGVSVDYLVRADITDISLDLSENIAKLAALIKSIYESEETPLNIKRIIEKQDINIDEIISQLTEVTFKAYHHKEIDEIRNALNSQGWKRVLEFAEEMRQIPKYQRLIDSAIYPAEDVKITPPVDE